MEVIKVNSYRTMKNDGLMKVWVGPQLFFVLCHPVDAEFLLKTCLDKSDLHKFTRNIIGNGGIFAPVPIWRRRRKVLVPTFSPKIVETFVDVFSKQSEKLVDILRKHYSSGKISMWPFLSSYTLDAVCETTMGVKLNAQENSNTPFLVSMNKVLNLVAERMFKPWLQPDCLYRLFPQHAKHDYYKENLHKFTDEVIKKKREEIKSVDKTKSENDEHKMKIFLDHLINLSDSKGVGLTDLELREEVLTLAIAGTDTSAVATGFTLKLLAKYPHIQEKVYEEIFDVFGDSSRPLVKKDLFNLKYLERVVKESLRLFPPVPNITRMTETETTLPSGRVIPAGIIVLLPIWGFHRDPKYWGPDAEHFDPDRFLPERYNLQHVCSFMPFSQGPRSCLGYQYAMMSIKTALSAILRNYKIIGEPESSSIPQIKVKIDIMLKDVDGYTVTLERRKPISN